MNIVPPQGVLDLQARPPLALARARVLRLRPFSDTSRVEATFIYTVTNYSDFRAYLALKEVTRPCPVEADAFV